MYNRQIRQGRNGARVTMDGDRKMTMDNIFCLEPNIVHELVLVLVRLLVRVLALALILVLVLVLVRVLVVHTWGDRLCCAADHVGSSLAL